MKGSRASRSPHGLAPRAPASASESRPGPCLRGPGGQRDPRPPFPDARPGPELAPSTGHPAADLRPSTHGPPRKGTGSAVCSAGLNAQHQASAFVQRTRVFFSSPSQPKPTSADDPLTTGDSVANIRNHISFRQLPPRPQLRLGTKTANRIHSFWGRMIRGPLHAPTFRNNSLCVKTRTNQRKGDAA